MGIVFPHPLDGDVMIPHCEVCDELLPQITQMHVHARLRAELYKSFPSPADPGVSCFGAD